MDRKAIALVVVLVISGLLGLSPAWSGADEEFADAKVNLERFRKNTKAQKFRDEWVKQITAFERFAQKNPKHPKACEALAESVKLWDGLYDVSKTRRDRNAAQEAHQRYGEKCPQSAGAQLTASKSDPLPPPPPMPGSPSSKTPAPAQSKPREIESENQFKGNVIRPSSTPAHLTAFEYDIVEGKSRFTIRFSRLPVTSFGEIGAEKDKPRRIYFDFRDTLLDESVKTQWPIYDGRVQAVRLNQFNESIARVTFELTDKTGNFTLSNEINPPTAIIIFFPLGAPTETEKEAVNVPPSSPSSPPTGTQEGPNAAPVPTPPGGTPKNAPVSDGNASSSQKSAKEPTNETPVPAPVEAKPAAKKKIPLIVVDPGHGGEDSGAVGPTGLKEKTVVLNLSILLKVLLEKNYGYRVLLTRDTDKTVDLAERARIANDANADLFISVHANANPKRKFSGIETFYLNNTTDDYSRRLAERENNSSGKPISDLDFILTDLNMNANIADSIALANLIQKSMVLRARRMYGNVVDRGIKSALFYVLINCKMPSVLVETSFISNPEEEKRLKNAKYLEQLASAIGEAVHYYFQNQDRLAQDL